MSINLTNLRVFREIMKTGSMSEAARNLNRTQPAISLALKNLETALGFELFVRDTRKLKPVPEAHYLFSEADEVLVRVNQLQRNMQQFASGQRGSLNVAAMPGITAVLLPEFLSEFTRDKPQVKLTLHTRSTTQLNEMVSSQGVDFGMGDFDSVGKPPAHTSVTRISGQCQVALPVDHPLLNTDNALSLEAIVKYPMAILEAQSEFALKIRNTCTDHGHADNIRFRSQTVLPILHFVASGLCGAVVDPLSVVTAQRLGIADKRIVFRELDEQILYDYSLLVPKFRPVSTLAKQMIEAWQAHVMDILTTMSAQPISRPEIQNHSSA